MNFRANVVCGLAGAAALTFAIAASGPTALVAKAQTAQSPLLNPAFVVKNWGDAEPKLTIDGKAVARGANFRYGLVPQLEGTDLVIWLAMESTKPTSLEIAAAGKK